MLALLLTLAVWTHARPYEALSSATQATFDTEKPKFRRDREVDVERIVVEFEPDLEAQTFKAAVTHKVRALAELPVLTLDARELDVEGVADANGNKLEHEVVEGKLKVRFPKPLALGERASIKIRYGGGPTFEGIHFYKPDPNYPGQPLIMWTQGQPETNSQWIPLYDYPNQRAASEMIVTVPDGLVAVSNGRLVSKQPAAKKGMTRWHWVQERPHVSYLIALYVGKYALVEDRPAKVAGKDVPVAYWVQPGREADAKLSFAKTPAMIEFFSQWLDEPYPWERYDQIFNYGQGGGMENTAATNMGDRFLRDRRALLGEDSDGINAHELAHQWFGDLLTCKDWSHIWINEAFATYFQMLWTEKDLGRDEYLWNLRQNARHYMGEAESYRRPIVTERYAHPWDVFDGHTYQKGSYVIHMLRQELGDKSFQQALRLHVNRVKDKVADTEDLRRAFEDTTGRALTEFFAQWVYGPGHPELKLKLSYDAKEKKLSLQASQKPAKKGLPVTFKLKLPIQLDSKTVVAELSEAEQTVSWDVPSRPKWAAVDPNAHVLAAYELEWPEDMLLAELQSSPSPLSRARAAETLAKKASPKVVAALRRCLEKDAFWGVASVCAEQLSKTGGTPALEALAASAGHKNPKVRRAVADALGAFTRRPEALAALKPLADDDAWTVQGAALRALGALRLPEARPLLEAKLKEESWNHVAQRAALEGLGNMRDKTLLPLLEPYLAPGRHVWVRDAAFSAWARAGEAHDGAWLNLALLLDTENNNMVRRSAAEALRALGDPRAIPSLIRAHSRTLHKRLQTSLRETADALREGRKGRVDELAGQVDDLTKKLEKLEKRLDEAEKKK